MPSQRRRAVCAVAAALFLAQAASAANITHDALVGGLQTHYSNPLFPLKWVHIPKCGTSFMSTVIPFACPDLEGYDGLVSVGYPQTRYGQGHKFQPILAELCKDKCGNLDCEQLIAHRPSPEELPAEDYQKLLFTVRHPKQRMVSACNHDFHSDGKQEHMEDYYAVKKLRKQRHPRCSTFAGLSFVKSCMTKMLTGTRCAGRGEVDDARLVEALHRVRTAGFVGITDWWDASIHMFHHIYGGTPWWDEMKNLRSGSHNKGSHPKDAQEDGGAAESATDDAESPPSWGPYNVSMLTEWVDCPDQIVFYAAVARFMGQMEQFGLNPRDFGIAPDAERKFWDEEMHEDCRAWMLRLV